LLSPYYFFLFLGFQFSLEQKSKRKAKKKTKKKTKQNKIQRLKKNEKRKRGKEKLRQEWRFKVRQQHCHHGEAGSQEQILRETRDSVIYYC